MLHRFRFAFIAAMALCLVSFHARQRAAADVDPPHQNDKAVAPKPITIGILYVGAKDDSGYNQSFAQAAATLRQMPGVTLIEQENVPETKQCQQVMTTMIDRGASIIFATSFGYFTPHIKELAPKYPSVAFFHAGGLLRRDSPKNIGTFFAYIDEAEWLCGMAAGAASKSGKLGYVGAKPIPAVLRDINAFELGAKSVNPKCTLTVSFTGDWFDPVREANAVNALADQGIDVVTGHIDSPKTLIKTAEKRGIMSIGYHANGSELAPKGYLTGAQWNWAPAMQKFVADRQAGNALPVNVMGSLADESVQLSPLGKAVPKDAQEKIEAVKKEMIAGKFQMYAGPLKDNQGNVVIPAGKVFDDQDLSLWGMNYLVEGVIGNVR